MHADSRRPPQAMRRSATSMRTLAQYLRFGTETGDRLKDTLAEDPEMVLAHCMKGYFFMLFCVPALVAKARRSLDAARRSAAERGATDRERRHLDALDAWIRGEFEAGRRRTSRRFSPSTRATSSR